MLTVVLELWFSRLAQHFFDDYCSNVGKDVFIVLILLALFFFLYLFIDLLRFWTFPSFLLLRILIIIQSFFPHFAALILRIKVEIIFLIYSVLIGLDGLICFHSGIVHVIGMNVWLWVGIELDFEVLGFVDKELISIVETIIGIWLQID